MSILIRNARVLTFDAARTDLPSADVLISGNSIVAVGQDLPPPTDGPVEIIDGRGKLVMPGLINAHLHSPGNFLKGALDDFPLELFMLYEVPPMGDTPTSDRLYYLRSLLGAMEMLKLGITSVHDDAFFNPLPMPETIDGIMSAYRDSGIRATVAIDQPNRPEYEKFPFLRDLITEEIRHEMDAAPRQSGEELLALYAWFVDRWHGAEAGRLRCSTSCSAPQRVTPDYLQALTEFSRVHDLPFNIHILETRLQRVLGQVDYGKSLIRYVHDLGCLDERKLVIHSIWVDEDDIALMAASGCCVTHNPISNLKIGSGVMPYRAIRDAGITIALGSDEASTDDSANLWTVAKTMGLIHKLSSPNWREWPKAREVLESAILGGAKSLRMEGKLGVVAPGYLADLILVDLDTIAFTPMNDLERQLVFTENGSSVVMTIVDGRIVMRDGALLTVDEAAVKAEIREMMREHDSTFAQIHEHATRLIPFYEAMYEKALEVDVGMMRWVPPFGTAGARP